MFLGRALVMPVLKIGAEEGLDIVEEFHLDESKTELQQTDELNHVQDSQKGLKQSVEALD